MKDKCYITYEKNLKFTTQNKTSVQFEPRFLYYFLYRNLHTVCGEFHADVGEGFFQLMEIRVI